jgi:hypothetical protein
MNLKGCIAMNRRRTLTLILTFIVLISALSGYIIGSFSVASGFSLKADDEVYPFGIDSITCTFSNRTILTIQYGDPFTIEQFVDGQWISVNNSDVDIRFELGLHTLKPLSSEKIAFPVSVYSSFDEVGAYRVELQGKAGKGTFTIYCPFSVK